MLQQYLPLAVLKLKHKANEVNLTTALQQYLPLAVLKLMERYIGSIILGNVATVLTACGIETYILLFFNTNII